MVDDEYSYLTTGPLQIQFVSGATLFAISQYAEEGTYSEVCQYPVYPCQCNNEVTDTISLMWVKVDSSSTSLNHIIPLVPKRGILFWMALCDTAFRVQKIGTARRNISAPHVQPSTDHLINVSFDRCLMRRFGQCCLGLDGDEDDDTCTQGIDWISCENCGGCYHNIICVGVCKEYISSISTPFYCMCINHSSEPEMWACTLAKSLFS